jgi:hypothetical protein
MFSTALDTPVDHAVDTPLFIHIACGGESPMKPGRFESYTQSTGPTATTTVLYL